MCVWAAGSQVFETARRSIFCFIFCCSTGRYNVLRQLEGFRVVKPILPHHVLERALHEASVGENVTVILDIFCMPPTPKPSFGIHFTQRAENMARLFAGAIASNVS